MAITFKLQGYWGSGPSWADINPATRTIVWCGQKDDITKSIQARTFQDGNHLADAVPPASGNDTCAAGQHLANVKWLGDSGAASAACTNAAGTVTNIDIQNITENQCGLRCRLYDDASGQHTTAHGRVYMFNGTTGQETTPATDVYVGGFYRKTGNTAWVHINTPSSGTPPSGWAADGKGGDVNGSRIDWEDRSLAAEQLFDVALSFAPGGAGAHAAIGVGAYVEYS